MSSVCFSRVRMSAASFVNVNQFTRSFAGHSHFATIKRTKGANDIKRANLFSKLSRAIAAAVKNGGPDPKVNHHLSGVLLECKRVQMPKDKVEKALYGKEAAVAELSVVFEAQSPSNVALIIECLTDNNNRCVAKVKEILTKASGQFQTPQLWQFEHCAVAEVLQPAGLDEAGIEKWQDTITEVALDVGVEDIEFKEKESENGTTSHIAFLMFPLASYASVMKALADAGYEVVASANSSYLPKNLVDLDDESAEQFFKLLDKLEEEGDVQKVYHNANVSD